jgi:hypothetical protein
VDQLEREVRELQEALHHSRQPLTNGK